MRPDEHKSKDSRRYQNKKLQQGDSSAADIAEARRRAQRGRDKGIGISAIRRRNGESELSEEDIERQKELQQQFSKRKLVSNVDRYHEMSEAEAKEQDAVLGIDREATQLADALEKVDDTSGSYFKFKGEEVYDQVEQNMHQAVLQVNFDIFEDALQKANVVQILGLPDKDAELMESAFNDPGMVLSKPIVPSFAKNMRGLVMLSPSKPVSLPKDDAEGITVRNNRTLTPHKAPIHDEGELDELLAMDSRQPSQLPENQSRIQVPTLKDNRPGQANLSLPKKSTLLSPPSKKITHTNPTLPQANADMDDQAWLDDMLG